MRDRAGSGNFSLTEDLTEAFRTYVNAWNLRDWAAVAEVVSANLLVNDAPRTVAEYLDDLKSHATEKPAVTRVVTHLALDGDLMGVVLGTRSAIDSGIEVAVYRWAYGRIAAMWTVPGLNAGLGHSAAGSTRLEPS